MKAKKRALLLGALAVLLTAAAVIPGALSKAGKLQGAADPEKEQLSATPGNISQVLEEDVTIRTEPEDNGAGHIAMLPPTQVGQKLTWEAINSFPIKYPDMPIAEMRELCVEFFGFTKTALWTPNETVKYIRNKGGTQDIMRKGDVYGGLPYVGVASGNVYRLMDFIDEQTGLLDICKYFEGDVDLSQYLTMDQLKYFGSQCSIGAYWGWARVMNSADYLWTQNAVPQRNFIFLGEYQNYDITVVEEWEGSEDVPGGHNTPLVCAAEGRQAIYRNYAQMQPGDGLIHYTTAGHLAMCASDAYVVDTDGNVITDLSMENLKNVTIDGENSYILITDQAQSWRNGVSEQGDQYLYKNRVKEKGTFASLFEGSYLCFTYEEFLGTDPVEETICRFSHTGSTITASQLFSAKVTANYGIADIYVIVTDDSGAEVYRHMVRTTKAGNMDMAIEENSKSVDKLGKLLPGTYNIEILVQLGTGERPTVYTGKLKV